MSKEFVDFFMQLLGTGIAVFGAGLLVLRLAWPKVEVHMLRINALNQNRDFSKALQQLRFTAYERLLLFAHRIEPQALMLRNHSPELSVSVFVQTIMQEVESEYQHNLTQQLYVSDAAWVFMTDLKTDTLSLLRNAKAGLPKDANLDQYIAVVLQHMKEMEQNPYAAVQLILKKELAA